jgi:hypothetical protein
MNALDLIIKLKEDKPETFRYSLSRIKDENFMESVIELTSFLPQGCKHSQRLWHLTNDVLYIPSCPICGNQNKFKDGSTGYTKFCSGNCEIKNKWLKTTPEQKEEIYKKQRNTNKERYGDEITFRVKSIKDKMKKTLQKNYGDHVNNPTQSKEINDKVKKSIKEKYGVENPGQTPQAKQTRIDKYGTENPFSSKEVQEKIRQTNLERYNVEYPMQKPEIFEKATKHRTYEYVASNGKTYMLQGYEKYALEELLKIYDDNDIVTGSSNISKHKKFKYEYDGKVRNYFPDFYIISENLIIEVKSLFTLEYEKEKNNLKKEAVLKTNTKFEFWIYEKTGDRLK